MKENTTISVLQTITMHHEGKLACSIFHYNTSAGALPKVTLYCEGNLTHASVPYIRSTNAFPRNACTMKEI